MDKLLALENVSYKYHTKEQETVAIKDLSFTVSNDEFVSIIGPSGCGKTTILSLIAGLLKPCNGKILLNTENKNTGFAYMLQKDHLFEWRTIEENVFLPLEIKKLNTKRNKDHALSLLDKYGLKDFKKAYPDNLSGGMRQRVALIRTLAINPDLLLLDEPFSALDYQTRLSVCEDVHTIIKSEHKTSILVTHDITEAIAMSDKVVVLSERPATVKAIYKINLKETSPIKRRYLPEFSKYFDLLWRHLNK